MESSIEHFLRQIHADLSELRDGKPYMAVPAGTTINPDDFAICLATVDGYVYEVGSSRKEFSIQSISKPLTYGMALEQRGPDVVDAKVDVEPSGDSFTDISLAPVTGRPANSMINAGAIAVASLIKESGGKSAIERIEEFYSDFAGRELKASDRVFQAERRNSDHNHALAYLLSSFNIIEGAPTDALDTYLRQCGVQITCRDLSMMAATFANSGVNPLTGKQVIGMNALERVLSVMMTSGMYDDAGDWVASVGMPAKSGVGGGIIAVLPGQAGLAVYSPPLDEHGTSVRGAAVCRRLSRDTNMHFVRSARAGRSAIRATYPINQVPSPVRRTEDASAVVRDYGHRAVIIEVAGDLLFAGTESMIREISSVADDVDLIILDTRRVDEFSKMSRDLLTVVVQNLHRSNRQMIFVDTDKKISQFASEHNAPSFPTRSTAVAHCEDILLELYWPQLSLPAVVPVSDSPALAHISDDDISTLVGHMESRTYNDGDVIRKIGQDFGGVFFIESGRIITTAHDTDNNPVRLSTLSAGMTFGELALSREERQDITQTAHGRVKVMVLTRRAIESLETNQPHLAVELWRALTREAYSRVDQYMREVTTLIRD